MTVNESEPSKPKLRWYQFSLRSLFILTTLVAIVCSWYVSWYAVERQKTAKIRAAVAEITKLGGEASYSHNRKDDVFHLIVQTTDAGLVHLKGLAKLNGLDLSHTPITDTGLVHLKGLTKLNNLYLHLTQITDAGLVHLKGLTKLQSLDFSYTRITDAGLEHLKGLTNLGRLNLRDTQVTAEGVKKLQEALPNCKIDR
jgi:hypothetical protein